MEIYIAAALGCLITAIGAYAIARRTTSGKIGTSDAAQLWLESGNLRRELRDEVVALRLEVIYLKKQIRELERELEELRRKFNGVKQ